MTSKLDLDVLWAVLDDTQHVSFDHDASRLKMMRIVLGLGQADVEIRSERFQIWWEGRGGSTYGPTLAPPVVRTLMELAGIKKLTGDTVATLDAEDTFNAPQYVAWFVRRDDGMDIFTRSIEPADAPDAPSPIPESGPLTVPLSWRAPERRVYLESDAGLACPHCSAVSHRLRELISGNVVCPKCGRTFPAPHA